MSNDVLLTRHSNTAFALAFAHDYALSCEAAALRELVVAKAREWYLDDTAAPAAWEPSGADFFSPALIEADLMWRGVSSGQYVGEHWLATFAVLALTT